MTARRAGPPVTTPGRVLFRGGIVFDGTGATPAPSDVVVDGDRIVDVGVGLDGDEEVDCTGRLVLPGLFDCHVHLMVDGDLSPTTHGATPFSLNFFLAAERMRRTLDCGITTVREAGGADLGVKEAQARGLVAGPRMQVSITVLSQTGGHGDHWEVCGAHVPGLLDAHPGRPDNVVDGVEAMRHKVREVIRAGADVVKICTSGGVISPRDDPRHAHFRDDELAMCVAEATAAHRFVMAHAQATDGIKAAVRAGVRSIEHGVYLDDEAIEMMLAAGTFLVPTLVAPQGVLDAADRGVTVPPYAIDKAIQVIEVHRASVRRAVEAGVRIAMGTDSGVVPHGQNLRELELMTEVGMSPAEVLVASTRGAAELMGLHHELGTIEPGNRADLVLVDVADPDGDAALAVDGLRDRIAAVYQDGRRVA